MIVQIENDYNRDSWATPGSEGLGWSLGFCLSTKFPGNANATGLEIPVKDHIGEASLRKLTPAPTSSCPFSSLESLRQGTGCSPTAPAVFSCS